MLLPILLYGLVKLALWYSAKTAIDKISQQAAGFIELNYQNISSSLKGSVSINGVTIFIPMVEESIQIKRIRLSADNVLTLLTLKSKIETQDIPKSLGLLIEGVAINLDSKIFKTSAEAEQTPSERFNTLACGDIKRFDGEVLKAMGYSEIRADFNMSYHYDPLAKTMQLNFNENIDRFFSLNLTANVAGIKRLPAAGEIAMGMAAVQDLSSLGLVKLSLEDDSFISRKVTFCAKQNKSKAQQYINKHATMVDNYLQQMGIKLHSSLIDAYKKYLQSPGNAIISMNFSDAVNLMELSDYMADDIIAQLGTEIYVNNKLVSPLSVQFNQPKFLNSLGNNQQNIEIHDPNVKPKIEKKYHLVNKNSLKQYNKYSVIIKIKKGKTYTGKLSVESPFRFEINVRTRGGNIGYFVNIEDIKSAQVFY
ncbi:MAG: hypothetical protein QM479_15735 [Pseudomonadota bacterium]